MNTSLESRYFAIKSQAPLLIIKVIQEVFRIPLPKVFLNHSNKERGDRDLIETFLDSKEVFISIKQHPIIQNNGSNRALP